MKFNGPLLSVFAWLTMLGAGCSADGVGISKGAGGGSGQGSGGAFAVGGTPGGGGAIGSGGASPSTGQTGSGGAPGTGGMSAVSGSGGRGIGGTVGTGGALGGASGVATGGTAATGGRGMGGIATGGARSGGATGAGGAGSGGSTTPGTSACSAGTSTSSDVVVNLASPQQKISGFGTSTAWSSTISAADADTLWSTTTGAGLSLHRIRIDTTGTGTSETSIAKLAVARGVTIWATPWTPPPADKDNNNTVMGHLSNGQDFATKLATFVSNMKNQGIPIYAVSAQNEPDANVTYESCVYTGASMSSFIGTYMGPALANSGAKIMAPETQNWYGFPNFGPALLSDTTAAGYISIFATHDYGGAIKAYPDIAKAGKEFWETEIYDTVTAEDPGMGSALRIVKRIHDALTIANMNAWHYWWIKGTGNDNGALWDKGTGQPSKRLWIMGNYSRFVRPGYQRVSTTGKVPSGILLTAFTNPADGTVVLVAANNNTSATSLSVFVSGAAPCAFTPYVTSAADSLASKSAVSVSDARLTYSLDAQSVTTFVGKP